jgi:hypothetical protein
MDNAIMGEAKERGHQVDWASNGSDKWIRACSFQLGSSYCCSVFGFLSFHSSSSQIDSSSDKGL